MQRFEKIGALLKQSFIASVVEKKNGILGRREQLQLELLELQTPTIPQDLRSLKTRDLLAVAEQQASFQRVKKTREVIQKELEKLDQQRSDLAQSEGQIEESLTALLNLLHSNLIESEKYFDRYSSRQIRELLFEGRLTLSSLCEVMLAQLGRLQETEQYQEFLRRREAFIRVLEREPESPPGEKARESLLKLMEEVSAVQIEEIFEPSQLQSFRDYVETCSQSFGPITRTELMTTAPEVGFTTDLEELETYRASYPEEGLTSQELRETFSFSLADGSLIHLDPSRVDDLIRKLPYSQKGIVYRQKVTIRNKETQETQNETLITFDGFLLLVKMVVEGRIILEESQLPPVHKRPYYGQINLDSASLTNAGVELFAFDEILRVHDERNAGLEIIPLQTPPSTSEMMRVGEHESRLNPRSVSYAALQVVFPHLWEILGLEPHMKVKDFFTVMQTKFELEEGVDKDFYYNDKSFWINEIGFMKIQKMLDNQSKNSSFVDPQVWNYFNLKNENAHELFEFVLTDYDQRIYVDNPPYAIWAEILRFQSDVSVPGTVLWQHRSQGSTVRSILHPDVRDNPSPVTSHRAWHYVSKRKSDLKIKLLSYKRKTALEAFSAFYDEHAKTIEAPSDMYDEFLFVVQQWIQKLQSDEALGQMSVEEFVQSYIERVFYKWSIPDSQNLYPLLSRNPRFSDDDLLQALRRSLLTENHHYRVESKGTTRRLLITHLLERAIVEALHLCTEEELPIEDIDAFLIFVEQSLHSKVVKKSKAEVKQDRQEDQAVLVTPGEVTFSSQAIFENPTQDDAEIIALYLREGFEYAVNIFLRFQEIYFKGREARTKRGRVGKDEILEVFRRKFQEKNGKTLTQDEQQARKDLWKFHVGSIREIAKILGQKKSVQDLTVSNLYRFLKMNVAQVAEFSSIHEQYNREKKGHVESIFTQLEEQVPTELYKRFMNLSVGELLNEPDFSSIVWEMLSAGKEEEQKHDTTEAAGSDEELNRLWELFYQTYDQVSLARVLAQYSEEQKILIRTTMLESQPVFEIGVQYSLEIPNLGIMHLQLKKKRFSVVRIEHPPELR